MFDLFRSQKQTVRFLLGGILLLVAASMVITLVPGLFSTPVSTNDQVLVEVNGSPVTALDVDAQLRDYQMTGQIPAESMVFLAAQTIENLITDEVLFQEAERLGLIPTDVELAERIRSQLSFVFEQGGVPAYQAFVQQRFRRSVPEFEEAVMRDLVIQMRLKRLVTDNVIVSDEELRRSFKKNNDKVQIEYAKVAAASFRSQVQPDEEQIRALYDQNTSPYQTQETRSIKVIRIRPEDVPPPDVSEAEARAYYDRNIDRYQVEQRVRASHIIFMTMDKSEEELGQIEAKANEVLAEVKAGGDFAELAKQYSEDPGTKDNGGDLGWVVRGQMVPAFEQATFALEPGGISDVVKTEYGYHIIKVHERDRAHVQTFDEVKDQIIQEIQAQRQQELKIQKMDSAMVVARKYGADFDAAGKELGVPVETYEDFTRTSLPPGLPTAPIFSSTVFSSPQGEVITDMAGEATVLAVVTEITPARTQEFEEVRGRVTEQWTMRQASELAQQRAQELADAARAAGNLQQAASKLGLSTQSSEFVSRSGVIPDFGNAQALGEIAFTGEPGTITGPVTGGSGDYFVYRVTARQEADMTEFYEKRDELYEQQVQGRRDEAFEIFRAVTRQRYEDEGKIERYQPRIDLLLQNIRRG